MGDNQNAVSASAMPRLQMLGYDINWLVNDAVIRLLNKIEQ